LLTAKEFAKQNIIDGRIINISSIGGVNIFKNRIDYNISKSAVIRLTEVLAKELAPNISVNCICPGIVDFGDDAILIAPRRFSESKIPSKNKIPMQRYANIDDIFDAIYFFASSSHYITGQVLNITGGMEL
jgi:3-oxoacyl-[acyl-carrier protein] reductase/pteridine reductase